MALQGDVELKPSVHSAEDIMTLIIFSVSQLLESHKDCGRNAALIKKFGKLLQPHWHRKKVGNAILRSPKAKCREKHC